MRVGKEIVALLVRWTGLALVVRHTVARRRASILMYHDPDPRTLDRHLRYLSARYNFISLSELVDARREGDWSRLPPRALVLTFDDGHRGNANLTTVFERYGAIPTIYTCSQLVGTDRHFWFFETEDPEPLKGKPNSERLAVLENRTGFTVTREYPASRQALSRTEIDALAECAEIGAHTRFHPVLTTCEDAECQIEITASKTELEELLGAPCNHFSYPNGDYGLREREYAEQAGYRSARSTDIGWNDARTDLFRLRILGTGDDVSVNRLAADLTGIPGFVARARKGSFDGRHPGVAERLRGRL